MKFCNILSLVALLILPNLPQVTSSNNTTVLPSLALPGITNPTVPDSSSIYTTNAFFINPMIVLRSSSTSAQVTGPASKATKGTSLSTYAVSASSTWSWNNTISANVLPSPTSASITSTTVSGTPSSTYYDKSSSEVYISTSVPNSSTIVTNGNISSISPTTHSSFSQAVTTTNINANINASQITDVMRSSTNTTINGDDDDDEDGLSTAQIAAIAGGCGAAVIILITIPIVWRLKTSPRQGSGTIPPLHNVEENAEMEIVDGNEQEAKNK